MLWPVLVRPEPRVDTWSVGDVVSPRLTWCDAPDLPAALLPRRVVLRAEPLHAPDTTTWGSLLTSGGLAAARVGPGEAGTVTVDGCLRYEGYFQSNEQLPRTTATVRRIRTVAVLHERGTDFWIPRPDVFRAADVPDTTGKQLADDPPFAEPYPDDEDPDPGPDSMVLLSPEQYFALARHLLPEQQWQAEHFLVDLEVPGTDTGCSDRPPGVPGDASAEP